MDRELLMDMTDLDKMIFTTGRSSWWLLLRREKMSGVGKVVFDVICTMKES